MCDANPPRKKKNDRKNPRRKKQKTGSRKNLVKKQGNSGQAHEATVRVPGVPRAERGVVRAARARARGRSAARGRRGAGAPRGRGAGAPRGRGDVYMLDAM